MATSLIGPRGTFVDAIEEGGYGALCVHVTGGGGGGSGGNVVITDVNIPSQTTTLGVSFSGPSSLHNGQVSVTTAGTAVALASSSVSISKVTIKANAGNTGDIFVGDSGVTSSNGLILAAGESVDVSIDDLNKVYIDSATNGDGISYIAG